MNYNQHSKREKTMKSRQHHQKNFTLIELLMIVIRPCCPRMMLLLSTSEIYRIIYTS